MILRHPRRLTRRRFVSLASSAAAAGFASPSPSSAHSFDITNSAPYIAQGETGNDAINNCGPATIAAAIAYSGVATPSVEELRGALGFYGPTSTDQWGGLLDIYHVPWHVTRSKRGMDEAIATGHVVIIAAWMADLSSAPDFEQASSPNHGQIGRYDGFSLGHSMLIVGRINNAKDYLVHDPNVFSTEPVDWYEDGSPKGAFRRYDANEIWNTVRVYAEGMGIAVPPPAKPEEVSTTSSQVEEGAGNPSLGPVRGDSTQSQTMDSRNQSVQLPAVRTNSIRRDARTATSGAAAIK